MNAQISDQIRRESLLGVASATTAFLIWGLTVIYFKAIRAVPAFEILMHRIVWSCLFLLLLVLILKKWPEFKQVVKSGRILLILLVTFLLKALHLLSQRGQTFEAYLTGGGPMKDELQKLVEMYGLEDRVTLVSKLYR